MHVEVSDTNAQGNQRARCLLRLGCQGQCMHQVVPAAGEGGVSLQQLLTVLAAVSCSSICRCAVVLILYRYGLSVSQQ